MAVPLGEDTAFVDAVFEDVGLDLVGHRRPLPGVVGTTLQFGEFRAAIERHPAHDLRRHEVLGLAAHLPDAPIGLAPVGRCLLDLPAQGVQQRLGEVPAGLDVQVHRVEQRAPDVVLLLVIGVVADADRGGAVVAAQMIEGRLRQLALTAHPVHHLERIADAVRVARDVEDEREEVVGFPVEPEGVQTPQCERRIAYPRVTVVPVTFSARCFGERGCRRREQRPGRAVGQSLECERAALQIGAPGMIREAARRDPFAPVVLGGDHLGDRLVEGVRHRAVPPRQCDEGRVALVEPTSRAGLAVLDAESQIRGHAQRRMLVRRVPAHRGGLLVDLAGVPPFGAAPVVVEGGFATDVQVHRPVHTAHRPQQHVLGLPVGRCAAVCRGALLDVVPGRHDQGVAHDHPARVGLPGRLEDQTAGQVPPCRGHGAIVRRQPEMARAAVQQCAEHAGGVGSRHAHPLHGSVARDQTGALAIREECVVVDGREHAPSEG